MDAVEACDRTSVADGAVHTYHEEHHVFTLYIRSMSRARKVNICLAIVCAAVRDSHATRPCLLGPAMDTPFHQRRNDAASRPQMRKISAGRQKKLGQGLVAPW